MNVSPESMNDAIKEYKRQRAAAGDDSVVMAMKLGATERANAALTAKVASLEKEIADLKAPKQQEEPKPE